MTRRANTNDSCAREVPIEMYGGMPGQESHLQGVPEILHLACGRSEPNVLRWTAIRWAAPCGVLSSPVGYPMATKALGMAGMVMEKQ